MFVAGNPVLGLSVLLNFVASGLVARLFLWRPLAAMRREQALLPLACLHLFRFIGMSMLVPGVVSPLLPPGFARDVAYGDLIAAILAIVAVLALVARASWALAAVWALNVWGALDLLNAMYQGALHFRIDPGWLGAAFFIPTVGVPVLLVSHVLMFAILLRPAAPVPVRA